MDVRLPEANRPSQYLPTIKELATGGINLRKSTMTSEIKNKMKTNRVANRAIFEKIAFIFTTYHYLSEDAVMYSGLSCRQSAIGLLLLFTNPVIIV